MPGEAFERHPWERARARFFVSALDAAGLLGSPLSVLDVGAGDAFFASELHRRLPAGSRVVCCDSNYSDQHLADLERTYGVGGLSFVRALPAPATADQRFDLVLLLDVLEHIGDDLGFLRALVDRLREGGHVLISVPAWMSLFTRHDIGVIHHRRYRPGQLAQVIRDAGLEIRAAGGLFHSLLAPRALQKLAERARGIRSVPAPSDAPDAAQTDIAQWRHGRAVTRAVDLALRADNAVSSLLARWRVPAPGLSAWALGRKTGAS